MPQKRRPQSGARPPRKKGSKKANVLVPILILMILVLLLVFSFALSGGESSENQSETSSQPSSSENPQSSSQDPSGSPASESSETATSPGEETVDKMDWALILVNQTHILPDDYEVKTADSFNGKEFEYRANEYLKEMFAAAEADGCPMFLTSAYRSKSYQTGLFEQSVKTLMGQGMTREEAEAETARNIAVPGQSEHATGLAADIVNPGFFNQHAELNEAFANTKQSDWLLEHAVDYGFVLRYPKDKTDITGINYEPWHWRFVGPYHAKKMKEMNVTLEEYTQMLGLS